jgi:pyruvate,water dikinase
VTGPALVLAFPDIGIEHRAAVGGKAAGLGELTRAGFAVPEGCVLTTRAFTAALHRIDPEGSIATRLAALDPDDHATLVRETGEFREKIISAPVPDDVRAAIRGWRALDVPGPPDTLGLAVRSSGTSEDSSDASFAGLQDTFLWVRGEDAVVDAIRRCWASLYSVESVTYRLRRGVPEGGLAMAVVIQRMVDARTSGVMFTRSPVTGDRSVVVVEAAWGLGSAVVGGEVTPDAWVLNKVTGEVIRRQVSAKLHRHRPDVERGGVRDEEVPPELRDTPSLGQEELAELLRVGIAVERHYGEPQDIEWAIPADPDAEHPLFVLQSRPETAWSARPATPVATPAPRAFDHVVARMGGRAARPDEGAPG